MVPSSWHKFKSLGIHHVAVLSTYNNIGLVHEQLGNFQKALEIDEKTLDIDIKSLGWAHVSAWRQLIRTWDRPKGAWKL